MPRRKHPQLIADGTVCILGAEVTPLIKVGGLGDVIGALPKELNNDVKKMYVIAPYNNSVPDEYKKVGTPFKSYAVKIGKKSAVFSVYKHTLPNSKVTLLLISNKRYLDGGTPYGGKETWNPLTQKMATKSDSQVIKFLAFSLAAQHLLRDLAPDVVHLNDWHTAMVAPLVKVDAELRNTKVVITVHNAEHVGEHRKKFFVLSPVLKSIYGVRGKLPFLKIGFDYADIINTVSKTYAEEMLQDGFGKGLEKALKGKEDRFLGVLNGIDTKLFNPRTDGNITHQYAGHFPSYKRDNKRALQEAVGFSPSSLPLLSFIHRISSQKGLDIISRYLHRQLPTIKAQFIFTGTGDPRYEKKFALFAKRFPEKFFFHNEFDVPFSQQLYAGSDMLLMPSKFEPCGLSQLIAMRYGTVPIVHATGGLKDTVHEGVNGFVFNRYSEPALSRALARAIRTYTTQPKKWKNIIHHGMYADYSWTRSADEYLAIYQSLLNQA